MIKLSTILQTFFLLCLAALTFPVAVAYAAPNVQFSPTSATVVKDGTVQINVTINVDTNTVMGADTVVNYAASDLQVVSVASGGFFPQFTDSTATSGKIELHGFVGQNDSRTGNGTLAVITLKGLLGSGSSTLSFACSGSGSDTDIISTTGQNILTCTQTNTAGLSYSTTNPTATLTPTATTIPGATATPTNTPTPTPTSGNGNTIPTCQSVTANITSMIGPRAVTFTCSGVDPDGYINGAQFTFGDGTTQVITKNVGSPGSISTTHSYTTIGSLGVSCLVQDNNSAWSNSTSACQTIIAIAPTPSPTPYYNQSVVLAYNGTPTPEVVSIISETPSPPITETPSAITPTSEESSSTGNFSRIWWILGGITAIILAIVLLRRRKNPPTPTPPANVVNTPTVKQNSPQSGETVHLET